MTLNNKMRSDQMISDQWSVNFRTLKQRFRFAQSRFRVNHWPMT